MKTYLKYILLFLTLTILLIVSCSKDDSVTPTDEVLLATVAGDSVGIQSGSSSRYIIINSPHTLDFTDRDNARISFYYSGVNNNVSIPMLISYLSGSSDIIIYNGSNLNTSSIEQFANINIPSPKVNARFKYKISTSSSSGFSYFKFRDLKIYKK